MFTPPSQYSVNKRTTSCFPAEVCRIFAPYAGRTPGNRNRCTTTARRRSSYTRSYFCLDNTDQMVVPTRGEKETLNAAGLGEQRLTFLGNYCVFHVVWPLWTCFWGTYLFVSSVTITYNSNDGIKKMWISFALNSFYRWWRQCRGVQMSHSDSLPQTQWLWGVWDFKSVRDDQEQKAFCDALPKHRVYHQIHQEPH